MDLIEWDLKESSGDVGELMEFFMGILRGFLGFGMLRALIGRLMGFHALLKGLFPGFNGIFTDPDGMFMNGFNAHSMGC